MTDKNSSREEDFMIISMEEYESFVKKKKRTTIQIRINEAKKKEWETFVEDLKNLKNLSQLVRKSVDDYIIRNYIDDFYPLQ